MVEQVGDRDHYNLDAIRQLLLAAFTAEELGRFCQDRPTFRPILVNFGPKYNLNDMVDEILFYCEPHGLFDQLVVAVREINPRQYARFEDLLHDPNYSPPVGAQAQPLLPLRKIGEFVRQAMIGDTEAAHAQRNRQAMLQLVRNTWIKGVLEQSLHSAVMIELGMEERVAAVEQPWDTVAQMPGQAHPQLPPGTKIVDVFDGMNQALLILGEPGSGKTTMLLTLARDTIARAERDPTQPIPVVLNLSSWAAKKMPIAQWLVEELRTKYYIPRKIAAPWVEDDQLLLLLDGLDEVKVEAREHCVQALNRFRGDHLVPMVVCSRIAGFEALETKLELYGAVFLQSLSPEQIDQYLEGVGTELEAVRAALGHDPVLQALANTPLMLSIMTLAYWGMTTEDLRGVDTRDTLRQHLFDTYVQRMFEHGIPHQPYTQGQTVQWLAWLAQNMSGQGQAVFLIEGLQPDWLPTRARRPACILARVALGLFAGLPAALSIWVTMIGILPLALLVGVLAGILVVGTLGGMDSVAPLEAVRWSWKRAGTALLWGLAFGLLIELLVLTQHVVDSPFGFFVVITGLMAGFFGGIQRNAMEVKTVPNQGIRRSGTFAILAGVPLGLLLAGLLVNVWNIYYAALRLEFGPSLHLGPLSAVVSLLAGGLVLGLGMALGAAWVVDRDPVQAVATVRWSWKRAGKGLVVGLVAGPVIGLGVAAVRAMLYPAESGGLYALLAWAGGLILAWGGFAIAVAAAFASALILFGGGAVALHLCIRLFLTLGNGIPWRLARFLDYATRRIFLRKVGGGYIFIHRLLQEYFASRWTEVTEP